MISEGFTEIKRTPFFFLNFEHLIWHPRGVGRVGKCLLLKVTEVEGERKLNTGFPDLSELSSCSVTKSSKYRL